MQPRVIGFDLARAYAILGMYIVNFNFSFGSIMFPVKPIDKFLALFSGNSTSIFIICAGMGLSFMSHKGDITAMEKASIKSKVLKRSWYLFALGLLLYNWWSGDILHFYGGYMHIAASLLFVPKKYYLIAAAIIISVFHLLLLIIPINTGWDFTDFSYNDFWTPVGFLRNTIYNGWNSIFPWLAYFLVGMWLGRLDWNIKSTRRKVFAIGLLLFCFFQLLRLMVKLEIFSSFWYEYISAEYFPPYLPFMGITTGFAFMVIAICISIGEKFKTSNIILTLQKVGQMTLSLYILHLTLGMILFAKLTGKEYTGFLEDETPTSSVYILMYSILFYLVSILFTISWTKKFKQGPFELLMRKISG